MEKKEKKKEKENLKKVDPEKYSLEYFPEIVNEPSAPVVPWPISAKELFITENSIPSIPLSLSSPVTGSFSFLSDTFIILIS